MARNHLRNTRNRERELERQRINRAMATPPPTMEETMQVPWFRIVTLP